MNKKYILWAGIMTVTLQGWAANPCLPIAQACMKAGYYRGGNTVGKGLVVNCVMPITQGASVIPNVSFPSDVLRACKATLATKMKEN